MCVYMCARACVEFQVRKLLIPQDSACHRFSCPEGSSSTFYLMQNHTYSRDTRRHYRMRLHHYSTFSHVHGFAQFDDWHTKAAPNQYIVNPAAVADSPAQELEASEARQNLNSIQGGSSLRCECTSVFIFF